MCDSAVVFVEEVTKKNCLLGGGSWVNAQNICVDEKKTEACQNSGCIFVARKEAFSE